MRTMPSTSALLRSAALAVALTPPGSGTGRLGRDALGPSGTGVGACAGVVRPAGTGTRTLGHDGLEASQALAWAPDEPRTRATSSYDVPSLPGPRTPPSPKHALARDRWRPGAFDRLDSCTASSGRADCHEPASSKETRDFHSRSGAHGVPLRPPEPGQPPPSILALSSSFIGHLPRWRPRCV